MSNKMTYKIILDNLIQEFELNKNAEQAVVMSAYMKNKFEFYGIKSPERKEISKSFISKLVKEFGEDYEDVSKILWKQNKRELHYVAMGFLLKTKKYWKDSSIDLFRDLITNKSWWDTVDFIATNLVGNYMLKFKSENYQLMKEWNKEENIWIIRVSILFQLKFKENADWDLLKSNIIAHKYSKEFFIRKAMGWALREYSKKEGERVVFFVDNHSELPSLTQREALKWLKK